MQLHRHDVQANGLDRRQQRDLIAVYAHAASGDDVGDVAGRDRSVELAGFAGLTDDDEALAVERGVHLLGFGLLFQIAGLKLGALIVEALLVGAGGAQRFALRQQEIARKAVAHLNGFAHLAQFGDAFEQNDFHVYSPFGLV